MAESEEKNLALLYYETQRCYSGYFTRTFGNLPQNDKKISDPYQANRMAVRNGAKIFTFVEDSRLPHRSCITGTLKDLKILLERGGHSISEDNIPGRWWYVPFSNGWEYRGFPEAKNEMIFRTFLKDVLDTFGQIS